MEPDFEWCVVQNDFRRFVISRYFSWWFGDRFEEASDFSPVGRLHFAAADGAK